MGFIRRVTKRWKAAGGTVGKIGKYAGYAYSAYKLAKAVYGVVNAEKKYFDYSNSAAANINGAVEDLTLVTTGTGPSQRNGQSILATSLTIRGFVDVDDVNTFHQTVRVIIFQDPTNAALTAAPAVGDVLEASASAFVVMSPYTRQFPQRYKIWYDKTFDLNPIGTASGRISFRKVIKFKQDLNKRMQKHMMWDETGDAQTDTRGGQVYILYCSDQNANNPTVRFYSRLRFTDN